MNPHYQAIAERAAHRCEYCHAPEVVFNVPFEVDHVTPLSKEGRDDPDNLALACRSCNLWKSDVVTAVDSETQVTIPLFNPHQQNWSDHFEPQSDPPFRLIGKTPTRRATIAQ